MITTSPPWRIPFKQAVNQSIGGTKLVKLPT